MDVNYVNICVYVRFAPVTFTRRISQDVGAMPVAKTPTSSVLFSQLTVAASGLPRTAPHFLRTTPQGHRR